MNDTIKAILTRDYQKTLFKGMLGAANKVVDTHQKRMGDAKLATVGALIARAVYDEAFTQAKVMSGAELPVAPVQRAGVPMTPPSSMQMAELAIQAVIAAKPEESLDLRAKVAGAAKVEPNSSPQMWASFSSDALRKKDLLEKGANTGSAQELDKIINSAV